MPNLWSDERKQDVSAIRKSWVVHQTHFQYDMSIICYAYCSIPDITRSVNLKTYAPSKPCKFHFRGRLNRFGPFWTLYKTFEVDSPSFNECWASNSCSRLWALSNPIIGDTSLNSQWLLFNLLIWGDFKMRVQARVCELSSDVNTLKHFDFKAKYLTLRWQKIVM